MSRLPAVLFLGLVFGFSIQSLGLRLELLAQTTIEHKAKFEKAKIGGLSGIYFDADASTLFAVSDDRGRVGEPRFFEFKFDYKANKLMVTPQAVHFLQRKQDGLSLKSVLDMEGIAPLPWGNFLISSEGDNNHKPRSPPELLDIKRDGTVVRAFDLPIKFIPEATGQQTRGIRNNRGFEALTKSPEPGAGEKLFLLTEESLVQDSSEDVGPVRLLTYDATEAWVIKPGKEYLYWPELGGGLTLGGRVSEALALSSDRLLVLERTMQLGAKSLSYQCKLFVASLAGATDVSAIQSLKANKLVLQPMKKELALDFETLKEKLGGTIENFEGLAFGPEVNKKKTLIVISDDNFKKSERTQVLLFSISE